MFCICPMQPPENQQSTTNCLNNNNVQQVMHPFDQEIMSTGILLGMYKSGREVYCRREILGGAEHLSMLYVHIYSLFIY